MPNLAGPNGAIPYSRDAWGYPSITARNEVEAAWAMGWFHGQDRQGQVALAVMAARGRLMELLGDVPIARAVDTCSRYLGIAHDAQAQVDKLGDQARRIGESYCAGFNAGVDAGKRPMVMRVLALRHRHQLSDIIVLYRFMGWFGLNSLTQASTQLIAQLCSDGASLESLELLLGDQARYGDREPSRSMSWPDVLRNMFAAAPGGSNAFAVNARRSGTGHALLMGEFHMQVGQIPPMLYAQHVDLPNERFMHGLSVPGIPSFAAARTERVAWSYTFGHARNVEVWAEKTREGKVNVGGLWQPMRRRVEKVKIRGKAAPRWWVMSETERGIIWGDAQTERVRPAIRWRGMDCVAQDLDVSVKMTSAGNVDELVELHRKIRCLSLAGTFADSQGRIAYCQTGAVTADLSALPRAGWLKSHDPELDESHRPVRVDPREGYLASANEANGAWTAYSEPPYRHQRLSELLGGEGVLHPDDLLRISYDELDAMARRLAPVWQPLLPNDQQARALCSWAVRQGARQDAEGRAHLAAFHKLHRHVTYALLEDRLGVTTAQRLLGDSSAILGFQARLDSLLALEEPGTLDRPALARLLTRAWHEYRAEPSVRGRPDGLTYDVAVPKLLFKDAVLQGKLPPALGFSALVDPLPGGPVSLFQSRGTPVAGELVVTGPAFHFLVDMGSRVSRYNIAGPASERRFGAGSLSDAVAAWASGELHELGKRS